MFLCNESCILITARKRSLRRLYFYTCLSVHRVVVSQHALQMVSQHALQMVSQHALQVSGGVYPSMPCLEWSGRGGFQAHTQGGSSGVWPGGVSRPTPRGRSPGPHLAGCVSQHALRQTLPADGYCCERYASYWNAFLFETTFVKIYSRNPK